MESERTEKLCSGNNKPFSSFTSHVISTFFKSFIVNVMQTCGLKLPVITARNRSSFSNRHSRKDYFYFLVKWRDFYNQKAR